MSEFTFALPDVGEGLAEATISRWIVNEGTSVTRMEPIVEIETAKSAVEIPSPVDGVLSRHGAQAGETIEVGTPLAVFIINGNVPVAEGPTGPGPSRSSAPEATAQAATFAGTTRTSRRAKAAPTVRRRAHQLGIDLATVEGAGPRGRVLMADLDGLLTQPDPVLDTDGAGEPRGGIQPARSERLSPMRTTIFETMTSAWASVPLITDIREADAAELQRVRPILRGDMDSQKLTYTTLFSAVVIAALREHPEFNVWLDAEHRTLKYRQHVDLGVAVSVPGGLSVGVVRHADTLNLEELSRAIVDVSARARDGNLPARQMQGATVTVTSFGTHGGWFGTPLVVPPQVVIVGFGAVRDTVVPRDGEPVVRATVPLSVSADHRVIDGAELSSFCSTIERFITEPVRMVAV